MTYSQGSAKAGVTPVANVSGQSLLVAGSAVGGGLLALPAVTYHAGVIPSIIALALVWSYMLCTAALLLEAASWTDRLPCFAIEKGGGMMAGYSPTRRQQQQKLQKLNLLGMAGRTLGGTGRTLTLALYVTVYAATMTSYLAEGGKQAVELMKTFTYCIETRFATDCGSEFAALSRHEPIGGSIVLAGQVLFAAVVGSIIFRGPIAVERVNSVCLIGAIVAFAILVRAAIISSGVDNRKDPGPSVSEFDSVRVSGQDWAAVLRAVPVMIVAFSYHNMVPSVFTVLGRDAKRARAAIGLGSGGALLMYVVWQIVTLGENSSSARTTISDESTPLSPTKEQIFAHLRSSAGLFLPLFCFLALVTSVLGVGLGCVDFAEDALTWNASSMPPHSLSFSSTIENEVRRYPRIAATLLTFVPCLAFAVAFPGAFLPALEFSGIFRQILFGVVPVAMIWRVRLRTMREYGKRDDEGKAETGGTCLNGAHLNKHDSDYLDSDIETLVETNDRSPSPPEIDVRRAGTGCDESNLEVLPGGMFGLGLTTVMTAILILIELKHLADSFLALSAI